MFQTTNQSGLLSVLADVIGLMAISLCLQSFTTEFIARLQESSRVGQMRKWAPHTKASFDFLRSMPAVRPLGAVVALVCGGVLINNLVVLFVFLRFYLCIVVGWGGMG